MAGLLWTAAETLKEFVAGRLKARWEALEGSLKRFVLAAALLALGGFLTACSALWLLGALFLALSKRADQALPALWTGLAGLVLAGLFLWAGNFRLWNRGPRSASAQPRRRENGPVRTYTAVDRRTPLREEAPR